jgi:hypothetical protein
MRRISCAACGGYLVDFLNLGSSPLADKFPQDSSVREHWYPLEVAVCSKCWLAQLREVVPADELYGEDYGFRTASSPAAVRYFAELAEKLMRVFPAESKRLTVEIACNDGTLLRHFADAGCKAIGIEPSGARPRETDIGIIPLPFTSELARNMHYSGNAGLVIACNVAAHVADPRDFLDGVRELLADDGVAVIEFQDLAALIAGCQYDHVYHEHRFFYSVRSFSRIAATCGLEVSGWERTPAQGGSVRVYLAKSEHPGIVSADLWLEHGSVYDDMQERAQYAKEKLLSLLQDELDEGRVVAGYGASAKSATLFNYCGIDGNRSPRMVKWVEDLTPGKIGRLTPGSRIPVRAPGIQPDTYLLTSWNYASSMIRREQKFLSDGGRIIIPGAVPVII